MNWRLRLLAQATWQPSACRLCGSPVAGPAVAVRGPQVDKPPLLPAHFCHLAVTLCAACLAAYAHPATLPVQPPGLWPETPPLQAWIGPYAAPARRYIHSLKYHRRADFGIVLGELLALALAAPWRQPPLVVPIPLHRERQRSRGYNQAALIAQPLATRLGWPVRSALQRTRPTRAQAELDGLRRYDNLLGAFTVDRSAVDGKRVLLVDDVCTTGATLAAAAAACRQAGAATVTAAVLFVAEAGDLSPPVEMRRLQEGDQRDEIA